MKEPAPFQELVDTRGAVKCKKESYGDILARGAPGQACCSSGSGGGKNSGLGGVQGGDGGGLSASLEEVLVNRPVPQEGKAVRR